MKIYVGTSLQAKGTNYVPYAPLAREDVRKELSTLACKDDVGIAIRHTK